MEQMSIEDVKKLQTEGPADASADSGAIALTGDPFVDMGALAMSVTPGKTLEDKIRFVTDVYVDRWKGKLHAVFLHSKITHISRGNKPDAQRKASLDYYLSFLKDQDSDSTGYCRICSIKGDLFKADRSNFPLIGSGDFANFHHLHESALMLCKLCLIRLYFLPLGLLQGGGNLMMLQVQNDYMRNFWKDDVILQNLDKISRKTSDGMLASKYRQPQNALFGLSSRLIQRFDLFEGPVQRIRLFVFSNFGAAPEVSIHDLPNTVFSFLQRVLKPDLKKDWTYFTRKHFHFRKTGFQFDDSSGEWRQIKKKTSTLLEHEEYEGNRTNIVYDRLLSGKSILGLLRKVHKHRNFPIHIAIAYLKEVRKMRQEQIDMIKKVSEKIIGLAKKDGGDYKRYLTPIEGARYAHQLRGALIRMAKACLKNQEVEPFIRFDDYVEYLFPDSQSWYEVRDMLLICLYEKLHDLNVAPEEVSDQPVADIEDLASAAIESEF